ncbi:MAG: class II histone deacetylase [Solirubrobacterales bacterium]|nr:class II histone deacetylase [Solirubrobacterales bacterium]
MKTGLVWHETYMWHDTGSGVAFLEPGGYLQPGEHVESPESKRRLRNLLEVSGLLERLTPIAPRPATREELARVHDEELIDRVARLSEEHGGLAGDEAPFGRGGYEIAARSAGGVLAAVEAVSAGEIDNAYALVRPPGHHAMPDQGFGFCIFNNGAVAAAHLREALGAGRVAIVDWDAHHGNGAQQIFWDEPEVLTVSIHQDGAFPPGSGGWDETGGPGATGTNLNVPVPPGTGVGGYSAAFERVIVPALERFRPDFILVACGFDPGPQDPLARLMVHSDGFREMTARVRDCAERICDGRMVMFHEGGYSKAYVPFCGLATIEALSGIESGVTDPFLAGYAGFPYQELQDLQDAVITRSEGQLEAIPRGER